MHKTASAALILWLSAAALGCGASSDADAPEEGEGTRSTPGDRSGAQAASSAGSSGQADDEASSAQAGDADEADGADEGRAAEPDLSAPDDVAAPPADAMVTESGLASKLLVAGEGTRHPVASDRVRVNYSGWQTDGMLFDSSLRRGMPSEFGLDRVIEGWTEGLQLMVEGEQRRFWIPEELAYAGSPDRPQGMLVFDVELIAILTP